MASNVASRRVRPVGTGLRLLDARPPAPAGVGKLAGSECGCGAGAEVAEERPCAGPGRYLERTAEQYGGWRPESGGEEQLIWIFGPACLT